MDSTDRVSFNISYFPFFASSMFFFFIEEVLVITREREREKVKFLVCIFHFVVVRFLRCPLFSSVSFLLPSFVSLSSKSILFPPSLRPEKTIFVSFVIKLFDSTRLIWVLSSRSHFILIDADCHRWLLSLLEALTWRWNIIIRTGIRTQFIKDTLLRLPLIKGRAT